MHKARMIRMYAERKQGEQERNKIIESKMKENKEETISS